MEKKGSLCRVLGAKYTRKATHKVSVLLVTNHVDIFYTNPEDAYFAVKAQGFGLFYH